MMDECFAYDCIVVASTGGTENIPPIERLVEMLG